MSTRGSLTSVLYSRKFLPWAILLSLVLLTFGFLKKVTTSISSSEVYNLLLNSGLNQTLSQFAAAQAAFETAGFTSAVFKSNNNAFGMKYVAQVNAVGEKNGYAFYETVNKSVADFVAWYTRHRSNVLSLPLFINSIESYVKFLKNNNYFEADETVYLSGCKYYYNLIFDASKA